MYQLDTLYRQGASSPLAEVKFQAGPPSFVDFADLKAAAIEKVLFVSVPVTTSAHSCERLNEMIDAALGKSRVVVILTHNIELLRARKLTAAESGRLLGGIQDHQAEALARKAGEMQATIYQRTRTFLEMGAVTAEKAVPFLESLRAYLETAEADDADQPDNRN